MNDPYEARFDPEGVSDRLLACLSRLTKSKPEG